MSKIRKSTNKELVEDLQAINTNGQFDKLIKMAKANYFHDYKQPEDVVCGKMLFAELSANIPELKPLRDAIINGEFDEVADEEDKAEMRKDLPPTMWKHLGLEPLN